MCLKTDKGNAKLNFWCEREDTMKLSRWDTFGKNFNLTVFFPFLLALFFHRYALWNAWKPFYSFFLFTMWCTFIYFLSPFHIEAVPIFLVLFLTPGCDQQYLPLNPFFHLLSSSHSLPSSPFTSSLPLINPCSSRYIVTLVKTHFSLSFFFLSTLPYFST